MKKASKKHWGGKREHSGRPKKMEQGKDVCVRLPQEAVDELKEIAWQNRVTFSAILREAVEQYLKRWRKKNR